MKRAVVKLWQRKVTLHTGWFVEELGVFLSCFWTLWILETVKTEYTSWLEYVFYLDISMFENISYTFLNTLDNCF
jgi:hypothetical protein